MSFSQFGGAINVGQSEGSKTLWDGIYLDYRVWFENLILSKLMIIIFKKHEIFIEHYMQQ